MEKKYAIIKHSIKYKDSGCYGITKYTNTIDYGHYNSKGEASKELESLYESFIKETNRKKDNYKGTYYERIKKNTWKAIDEYDRWHNDTYSILNFSISIVYE